MASAAASSSTDEDYEPPADSQGGEKATAGSRGSKRPSARQGRGHPRETGASRERTRDPSRDSNGAVAGGRRSQRGSSSLSQAEAAAAADLEARRYDPERGALRRLLSRLRREGEANGRGAGSVDVDRATYLLEASAGNVVLASGLYWEVRI